MLQNKCADLRQIPIGFHAAEGASVSLPSTAYKARKAVKPPQELGVFADARFER